MRERYRSGEQLHNPADSLAKVEQRPDPEPPFGLHNLGQKDSSQTGQAI